VLGAAALGVPRGIWVLPDGRLHAWTLAGVCRAYSRQLHRNLLRQRAITPPKLQLIVSAAEGDYAAASHSKALQAAGQGGELINAAAKGMGKAVYALIKAKTCITAEKVRASSRLWGVSLGVRLAASCVCPWPLA
jgi:hypothetical protein